MIGKKTFNEIATTQRRSDRSSESMLHLEDVTLRVPRMGALCWRGLIWTFLRGEIVGIAGVEGNGQSELIEILTGIAEK